MAPATYCCARCGGVGQRVAEREAGGDRRRERAAGAVRVARCRSRGVAELVERVSVEQQVDDSSWPPRSPMPAGDDDRRGAHVVNPPRRLARVVRRRDAHGRSALRLPGMFGVTTRARGSSSAQQRLHAVRRRAGARRSSRPAPGRRRRAADRAPRSRRPPLRRSPRWRACRFSWRGSRVAGDRLDLRRDEIGRQRRDRLDAAACSAR